ncbi:MAG: cytochrome C oxidase subunit IV family protein [Motiliproteus sp.]
MTKNIYIWLLLMVLTVFSYVLTDTSTFAGVTAVILAVTAIKAWFIVDGFMELHGTSHVIRTAMLLYGIVLGGIILYILVG